MQSAAQRPVNWFAVHRLPVLDALDAGTLSVRPRLQANHAEHRRLEGSAGATRRSLAASARRYVETYCYAFAAPDFLESEQQQLYWAPTRCR